MGFRSVAKSDFQSLRIGKEVDIHRAQKKVPEGLKQIEQRTWDKLL